MGGLMKLKPLFWIRNGLLSDISEKDILLIDGQELCDNKESAPQFGWFEVASRIYSRPSFVFRNRITFFLDYVVGLHQGNY